MQALTARLAEPAKLLLIVGIAYTLASTAWYFVSDPTPAPLANATTSAGQRPAGVTLDRILAANLFGRTDASAAPQPSAYDAPETRLKLTLEGVFHDADNPTNSAAIIAEQGRPGELFHVGQKLSGGAELLEVHADRVVLRRGALLETLKFPDEPTLLAGNPVGNLVDESVVESYVEEPVYEGSFDSAGAEGGENPQLLMRNGDSAIGATIAQYRSRLDADPAGTLSELGVTPVSGESAQGYQLGNLANSPYLSQTGLQAGDVVVSVNGRPVGNVQQDRLELDNIMAQGSARLEVQRGDRRFFVTASIDD